MKQTERTFVSDASASSLSMKVVLDSALMLVIADSISGMQLSTGRSLGSIRTPNSLLLKETSDRAR